MEISEYLSDPCSASSLPYWKTESFEIPENVRIIRDDLLSASAYPGTDEPYFRMMHDLKSVREVFLPEGYEITQCPAETYAQHINACYTRERISAEQLRTCQSRFVYRPDLWIAVRDSRNGRIAATGIADLDSRIGEGIPEWIQVSPEYRRKGLGTFVVCELLRRMRNQARFATVSGRVANETAPFSLYRACGFTHPVIWHIVLEDRPGRAGRPLL